MGGLRNFIAKIGELIRTPLKSAAALAEVIGHDEQLRFKPRERPFRAGYGFDLGTFNVHLYKIHAWEIGSLTPFIECDGCNPLGKIEFSREVTR